MIRRPPRSTQSRSSAASDVYKRQVLGRLTERGEDFRCDAVPIRRADGSGDRVPVHHWIKKGRRRARNGHEQTTTEASYRSHNHSRASCGGSWPHVARIEQSPPVSYTHLRAHETRHDLVCRLLLEKKKTKI